MRVCEARFPNWFWRTNHVASDLLGIGLRYNRADTEDRVPVLDSGEQFQEMSVMHAGGVGFDEIVDQSFLWGEEYSARFGAPRSWV